MSSAFTLEPLGKAIASGRHSPTLRVPERAVMDSGLPTADGEGLHELRRVLSPSDWRAYHAIRRDTIFAPLLPGHLYDEADADEFRPGHLPHVLIFAGDIVGVVRI